MTVKDCKQCSLTFSSKSLTALRVMQAYRYERERRDE
jgi:hypothetical protein